MIKIGGIYSYKRSHYKVLHEGQMKWKDKWIEAVVYEALYDTASKTNIFIRDMATFLLKFKLVK